MYSILLEETRTRTESQMYAQKEFFRSILERAGRALPAGVFQLSEQIFAHTSLASPADVTTQLKTKSSEDPPASYPLCLFSHVWSFSINSDPTSRLYLRVTEKSGRKDSQLKRATVVAGLGTLEGVLSVQWAPLLYSCHNKSWRGLGGRGCLRLKMSHADESSES